MGKTEHNSLLMGGGATGDSEAQVRGLCVLAVVLPRIRRNFIFTFVGLPSRAEAWWTAQKRKEKKKEPHRHLNGRLACHRVVESPIIRAC